MVTLNAHFDGKTIVLDEPLSLPLAAGARLRIREEPVEPTAQLPSGARFEALRLEVDPDLSMAIGSDPQFNIEES